MQPGRRTRSHTFTAGPITPGCATFCSIGDPNPGHLLYEQPVATQSCGDGWVLSVLQLYAYSFALMSGTICSAAHIVPIGPPLVIAHRTSPPSAVRGGRPTQ